MGCMFRYMCSPDRSPDRKAQPFPAPLDVPSAPEPKQPQPSKQPPQPAAAVAPASKAPASAGNDWQPVHAKQAPNKAPSKAPAATKIVPAKEVGFSLSTFMLYIWSYVLSNAWESDTEEVGY